MEQPIEQPIAQSQDKKIVSVVIVILLVLVAGYVLFGKYRASNQANLPVSGDTDDESAMVVVENTPMVNGTLSVPTNFPQEIPIERGEILESALTRYPEQNAQQLSVSYRSLRTVAQKYAEYKSYLNQAGYDITEGGANAPVRAIFGTKEAANLSVFISRADNRTLVQLSYLVK